MSILVNQFTCAFKGHDASLTDVSILNKQDFINGIREYKTNCVRCNYPITLRKLKVRPDKYQIIER